MRTVIFPDIKFRGQPIIWIENDNKATCTFKIQKSTSTLNKLAMLQELMKTPGITCQHGEATIDDIKSFVKMHPLEEITEEAPHEGADTSTRPRKAFFEESRSISPGKSLHSKSPGMLRRSQSVTPETHQPSEKATLSTISKSTGFVALHSRPIRIKTTPRLATENSVIVSEPASSSAPKFKQSIARKGIELFTVLGEQINADLWRKSGVYYQEFENASKKQRAREEAYQIKSSKDLIMDLRLKLNETFVSTRSELMHTVEVILKKLNKALTIAEGDEEFTSEDLYHLLEQAIETLMVNKECDYRPTEYQLMKEGEWQEILRSDNPEDFQAAVEEQQLQRAAQRVKIFSYFTTNSEVNVERLTRNVQLQQLLKSIKLYCRSDSAELSENINKLITLTRQSVLNDINNKEMFQIHEKKIREFKSVGKYSSVHGVISTVINALYHPMVEEKPTKNSKKSSKPKELSRKDLKKQEKDLKKQEIVQNNLKELTNHFMVELIAAFGSFLNSAQHTKLYHSIIYAERKDLYIPTYRAEQLKIYLLDEIMKISTKEGGLYQNKDNELVLNAELNEKLHTIVLNELELLLRTKPNLQLQEPTTMTRTSSLDILSDASVNSEDEDNNAETNGVGASYS